MLMTQFTEMSITPYPESINAPDLQIWDNAAFDNGESATAVEASWSLLQLVNRSESIGSDVCKENLSPNAAQSSVPMIGNSHGKPVKGKLGVCEERKIDSEIEEIENEISRLSSKLEALRMEKIERSVKSTVESRGRVVPAKFMEQKHILRNSEPPSAQLKLNRRGFSAGPAEIAARSRQMGKPEITPLQPIQNRRKSCLWKLQEIDETKIRRQSLSPKSRRTVSKVQAPKQAATTVGSRKLSKRENSVVAAIQPKKLFRDGDKSVTAKKSAKMGRVVPSRYSQIQSNGSSVVSERKRSLPHDGNEDAKRSDKRHASLMGKSWGTDLRVKKKWEIPSDLVVYKGVDENVLPRIKTNNNLRVNDSPRDSGMIRTRFVFGPEVEEEPSVCQALTFADDAEEE